MMVNTLTSAYSVMWADLRFMRRRWHRTLMTTLASPILYLVAFLVAMFELLKVSTPAVDNTYEAITMVGFWVFMVVCLVVGLLTTVHIFRNTEFFIITLMSGFQSAFGLLLNSRTLKRTITDQR